MAMNQMMIFSYKAPPAATYTATITFSGSGSTQITGIKVNGYQILSGTTAATTNPSIVAQRVTVNINACTATAYNACTINGHSALLSGAVVTITSPYAGDAGLPPIVSKSGAMTVTTTAFV